MSDELVREVARAICKSRTCEGYACCQWPANGGRTSCNVKTGGYDDAANAAIAVIVAHGERLADEFLANSLTEVVPEAQKTLRNSRKS